MKKFPFGIYFIICLLIVICPVSKLLASGDPFKPMLVKVEANWDQFQPNETLILTCWWQNTGTEPSVKPYSGFMELSFGHQRIVETTPRYFRNYWEPYPATNLWKPGEVWKTTIRYNLKMGWGGSYKIAVGLCDEDHLPVDIIGEDGKTVKQVVAGQIELAWGWGTPTIERMRKPWAKEINRIKSADDHTQVDKSSIITIGKEPGINLMNNIPVIFSIGEVENDLNSSDMQPSLMLRNYKSDQLIYSNSPEVKVQYSVREIQNTAVVYHGVVMEKSQKLAAFNLRFESVGRQLHILLSEVIEQPEYELLEVKLPSILNLAGDDVTMVSFFGGGRLIHLKEALPEGYTFSYDTRNAAALIRANDQIVLESTCLDDKLIEAVYETDKMRTANLGMVLVNRVRGNGKVVSIPVESDHKITIELLDKTWGKAGWQSVAKYLRKDLQGKSRDIYNRSLFYKTLATSGPEPPSGYVKDNSPYGVKRLTYVVKFNDILEQIKMRYYIFDGMTQVSYIGGFEEGGFDNSYPYVFNTDQRAGTIEDLKHCITEGKKFNAIVGLHDNYDTDVPGGNYYDQRIAAKDKDGKTWKGWIWAGGIEHIVAPYKYAKLGLMQERVKKTVELYGLNISSHLDVLSSELLRYDFDPEYPASADKSHIGKLAIIDEYNKYGIDLTSESLVHPFVGHIGHALWPREDKDSKLFKGDRYIPLVPFIYHGTIGYCGSAANDNGLLWCLIKASKYFPSEEGFTDNDIMSIYIQHIPVELFYNKKMESFIEDGEITKVVYDDKSYIQVNYKDKTYEVVCDGELIAKDWTTFAPGFSKDTWLAYSKAGGKFDYPLPSAIINSKELHAVTLTREGEGKVLPCKVVNGHVILDMPQGVPVRITSKQ